MLDGVDYPELADHTDRLRRGAPHAVRVGGDGSRVSFLRSAGPADPVAALWTLTVGTGVERLVADPARLVGGEPAPPPGGIRAYATDAAGRVAAFAYARRLFRADLVTGEVAGLATEAPVSDPRPDPRGAGIAYLSVAAGGPAQLRVVRPDGTDELLAGEAEVSWGVLPPLGLSARPDTGYWWAPDGRSLLAVRADAGRLPRPRAVDADRDADRTVVLPRAGGPLPRVS